MESKKKKRKWGDEVNTSIPHITLPGHTHWVHSVSFSARGSKAASCGWDQLLKIWDVATGQEFLSLISKGRLRSCAFSLSKEEEDGVFIASAGGDGTVNIWDTRAGGTAIKSLATKGSGEIESCAFSSAGMNGWIVAGSNDSKVRLWDLQSDKEYLTLVGHTKAITSCSFSHLDPNSILSSSGDGTAVLWSIGEGEVKQRVVFKDGKSGVRCCNLSPDDTTICTGSFDNALRLWNVGSQEIHSTKEDEEKEGEPEKKKLKVGEDEEPKKQEGEKEEPAIKGGEPIVPTKYLRGHTGWLFSCEFWPKDGRYLVSGAGNPDYGVNLWDVTVNKILHKLPGNLDHVPDCAFSPDGRLLLTTAESHVLKLWDLTATLPCG